MAKGGDGIPMKKSTDLTKTWLDMEKLYKIGIAKVIFVYLVHGLKVYRVKFLQILSLISIL